VTAPRARVKAKLKEMLRDYEDGLAIAPSELTLIKAANQFRELDAHMTPFCTRQLTNVRCAVAAPNGGYLPLSGPLGAVKAG